jgi:hypothetical protein
MTTKATTHETKRFRLATNDNETIVVDRADRRRFRLAANDNETIVDDEDTEGHRLATNDNDTIVHGGTTDDSDAVDDESPVSLGARRLRR